MKQEQINYRKIMDLGFDEEFIHDKVYEDQNGFQYTFISKELTKKLYLQWDKETKLCKMVRLSKPKTGDIGAELPITDLQHLKDMICFFLNDNKKDFEHFTGA
jgi:hypothetical protein